MKERYIFITDVPFPKSGALSNYIEQIIKTLLLGIKGARIFVFSPKSSHKSTIKNVCFYEFDLRNDGSTFRRFIADGMKSINISKNDRIFNFLSKGKNIIWFYYKFNKFNSVTISFFGEWFNLKYFDNNSRGLLRYLRYRVSFIFREKYDHAIVISSYLKKHINCKHILCIPGMYDSISGKNTSKKKWNNRRFIYPGGDIRKDRIDSIINLFYKLKHDGVEDIEIHLTGISIETVRSIVDNEIIDELEGVLFVHGWMEENEYVSLLEEMGFVIIIRETNQITKANFPTKIPELMGEGIIPIVSKVGDYTELYLRNKYDSFIIQGSEIERFSFVIRELLRLNDEELLKYHNNAISTAKDVFGISNWTGILKDYLITNF